LPPAVANLKGRRGVKRVPDSRQYKKNKKGRGIKAPPAQTVPYGFWAKREDHKRRKHLRFNIRKKKEERRAMKRNFEEENRGGEEVENVTYAL